MIFDRMQEDHYKVRAKRFCPEVFSKDTDYPRGRELFLAMIDALDNDTAGEEWSYYNSLVNLVIQFNYDSIIPKEEMFKALERSEQLGERLIIIPHEHHLPGGLGYNQLDGWCLKVETPTDMWSNKERIIQLLLAKCDALEEIRILEKKVRTDKENDRLEKLLQLVRSADYYLDLFKGHNAIVIHI